YWNQGPGSECSTNSVLSGLPLKGVRIDDDSFVDITIEDQERKFNINMADEKILESVLQSMQVDSGEIPRIVSAIQDWVDFDSVTRINGAESADYQAMDPPYFAKDRPIDDMTELQLVRGITAHMLDG